jgi:hypothetical protein
MILAVDQFQRQNESTILPPWTNADSAGTKLFQVLSNSAQVTNLSLDTAWRYNPEAVTTAGSTGLTIGVGASWPSDQWAEVQVIFSGTTAGTGYGPMLRSSLDDSNNYYRCCVNGTDITISKNVSGTATALATLKPGVSGDVIRFTAVGDVLSVFRNGLLWGRTTDNTFRRGFPGIAYSSTLTSGQINYFVAGSMDGNPFEQSPHQGYDLLGMHRNRAIPGY